MRYFWIKHSQNVASAFLFRFLATQKHIGLNIYILLSLHKKMLNINEYTIKEKAVLKYKCLNELSFFIRVFFKIIHGDRFLLNWHHKEINNELTKIYKREYDNLIINIPPRHSKTTMLIFFTAWSIAKNPKSLFLYISASDKLANDNSRLVRSIITNPLFLELFGVEISQDTTAKNHWRTNKGGGITTATINGQITGFGAGSLQDADNFNGAIIIDDPNKINAEYSDIEKDMPNKRFIDTIMSRRNGKRTPIILIQQRAFIGDLSGFLMQGKSGIVFKVVKFPIIVNGKPLWENKLDLSDIEKLKSVPEIKFVFDAQYMQDPKKREGLLFDAEKIKYFDVNMLDKNFDTILSHTDVADGGGDYLACVIVGIIDEKIYLLDVVFNKNSSKITEYQVINKFDKWKVEKALFESNNQGRMYSKDIQRLVVEKNKYKTEVKAYPNNTNKLSRIIIQGDYIIDNFYFIKYEQQSDEYKDFIANLLSFQKDGKNKHDDAPDTISGLAKYIRIKVLIK